MYRYQASWRFLCCSLENAINIEERGILLKSPWNILQNTYSLPACVGRMAESEFNCLIFCHSLYALVVAFHVNAAQDRERDIKLLQAAVEPPPARFV